MKFLFLNHIPFQPVFQINVENIVNDSEFQQVSQNFEGNSDNIDKVKLQLYKEAKDKKVISQEYQSSMDDSLADKKEEKICKQNTANVTVKKHNLGRPKKNKINLEVINPIFKLFMFCFSLCD